jgi:ABC-type protease/lipase transport system fused ATPase/permease subunit
VAVPTLVAAGLWLNLSGNLSLGALVAAAMLHHHALAAMSAWLAAIPQLNAGMRAYKDLKQSLAIPKGIAQPTTIAAEPPVHAGTNAQLPAPIRHAVAR